MRTAVCLIIVTLATWHAEAAPVPPEPNPIPEVERLRDEVDRRQKDREEIEAYSARLRRLLEIAGCPSEDLVRKHSFKEKLDRILPGVAFRKTPLAVAIQRLSYQADLHVRVDWAALVDLHAVPTSVVNVDTRNMRLCEAIRAIISNAQHEPRPTLYVDENQVTITSYEKANEHLAVLGYDMTVPLGAQFGDRRLTLEQRKEQLQLLVTSIVAPDSWQENGGNAGVIEFRGTTMFVRQTTENHESLDELLVQLDPAQSIERLRQTLNQIADQLTSMEKEVGQLTARCRAVGITAPPPVSESAYKILPDMQFVHTSLSKCVNRLCQASGQIIYADWQQLQSDCLDTPVTITLHGQTLEQALRALVLAASNNSSQPQRLCVGVWNGAWGIRDSALARETSTKIYDLHSLLPPESATNPQAREARVEMIFRLILHTVAPDAWREAGGQVGTGRSFGDVIVIAQTDAAHAQIKAVLDVLRTHVDPNERDKIVDVCPGNSLAPGSSHLLTRIRMYDARDIFLRQGLRYVDDQLSRLISETFVPDSWRTSGGVLGVLEEGGGLFFIDQTDDVHARIEKLFVALRSLPQKHIAAPIDLQFDAANRIKTRLYDVRDLLPARTSRNFDRDVEDLIRRLVKDIDPDSWREAGGSVGSISEYMGALIVSHTDATQLRIQAWLDAERRRAHRR